jgi:hypothetical protein
MQDVIERAAAGMSSSPRSTPRRVGAGDLGSRCGEGTRKVEIDAKVPCAPGARLLSDRLVKGGELA